MKKVDVENAVGMTLCHDITAVRDGFKGAAFRRGHVITEADIPALLDLGIAGVNSALIHDKLIQRAVITYVRMMFHSPADFDHLRWAYETLKGQMAIASGYTEWGRLNGSSGCPNADH